MTVKLVAIDVDKTLVDDEKQLHEKVIETIKAASQREVKVVICSGRPLPGLKQILTDLNLANQKDQYVVCFGGSVVQSTAGEVIMSQGLAYEDYLDLELIARKLDLPFHAVSMDRIYTANRDIGYYSMYESNLVNMPLSYRTPAELKEIPLIKAMFVEEPAKLDQAFAAGRALFAAKEDRVTFVKSQPFFLEANTKGVDKAQALTKLCAHLGLNLSQDVMAIGDGGNDLPMIKAAKIGVAMANALPEVKAASDFVTADNNHDGVAVAIEKFILA